MRNRKTKLPLGHPRKYTSKGTAQVEQEKRIQQNKALIAAGQREAEQQAAAAITAAREDAAAHWDAAWQNFNDSNLAEAIRQRDGRCRAVEVRSG